MAPVVSSRAVPTALCKAALDEATGDSNLTIIAADLAGLSFALSMAAGCRD
jgi:hypothetical protein